jgi:hypothetical protein
MEACTPPSFLGPRPPSPGKRIVKGSLTQGCWLMLHRTFNRMVIVQIRGRVHLSRHVLTRWCCGITEESAEYAY